MVINNHTVNFCDENKNLDVSVVGELSEIVAEISDIEDDANAKTMSSMVARTKAAAPSSFGSVSVSHSENVQFGNNTYFQGPVTIKQYNIQNKSGIENGSYTKTDDENDLKPPNTKTKDSGNDTDSFVFKTWHKITISIIAFLVLFGCGIAFGIRREPDTSDDEPASKRVSGSCHETSSEFRMIAIVVAPFISAWASYCVLTMKLRFPFHYLKWHSVKTTTKMKTASKLNTNKIAGEQGDILIAPDHLRIVSRMEWLAQPETGPLDKLRLPAPWVIICHTATDFCYNQSSCVYNVRLVQEFHIGSRGWYDIGYNFLVGGDGSAYYGRGWDYIGAHTLGYNKYSIGIGFIGTFSIEAPLQKQLDACKKLIKRGVAAGKIAKDYKLFAHRQLMSTSSPGDKLYEILQEWPHFVNDTTQLDTLLPNY